jgi:hypothetical protein
MKRIHLIAVVLMAMATAKAEDLCAGKDAGTITFYDQFISRDSKLPKAVTSFDGTKPVYALMCLGSAVGPQEKGGAKFRVTLNVDGRQRGVARPQLAKARQEVIVPISENFEGELKELDTGRHELRFQATESGTEVASGKIVFQKSE